MLANESLVIGKLPQSLNVFTIFNEVLSSITLTQLSGSDSKVYSLKV